jgi:uncharacterized protein (DUF3820 family)
MFEKEDLIRIANQPMPFGKYKGRVLVDLPEEYLLWFTKRGFPDGQLGELMKLTLEIKINGLESLMEPLRKVNTSGSISASKNLNRKKISFD